MRNRNGKRNTLCRALPALCLAFCLAFLPALCPAAGTATAEYSGFPGYPGYNGYPGNNGNNGGFGSPFGNMPGMGGQQGQDSWQYPGMDGQQGQEGQYPGMPAAETKLTVMPSARSVRSGETVTLDYDLQLSQTDMEKVSIIQQGAELEYSLLYYTIEEQQVPADDSSGSDGQTTDAPSKDDPDYTVPSESAGQAGTGPSASEGQLLRRTDKASVSFTMNRENNERCTLTVQPQTDQTCTMKVEATMILRDGTTLSCTSDAILVYLEDAIRSHVLTRDCADGGQVQVAWMILGQEGNYSFRCYTAVSDDAGQTWFRTDGDPYVFTVNTHEREPNVTVAVPVNTGKSCMFRVEAEITLPDGKVLFSNTDPVRVSLGGTQL